MRERDARGLARLLRVAMLCVGLAAAVPAHADSPIAPDQRRGAEQTLLTYPEWFLVHSPAEYARYVADHPAHGFPFLEHIRQLWSSYASVTREQMREDAPANLGYHTMILVIGTSTTVEYALRSAYENTVGRVAWATASDLTAEDRYGARVAQDYVDFIRRQPWYLFDFGARLRGLWADVPLGGTGVVRKWERRYALTTEYAVKAAYAWLIERATRAAYDPALLTTQVVVDRVPATLPTGVRVVQPLADGRAIVEMPRYFDFRIAAGALAAEGVRFVDIAGNTSRILVTVWARERVALPPGADVLFDQPIVTVPGTRRIAVLLPVDALAAFLNDAPRRRIEIEHIYDY